MSNNIFRKQDDTMKEHVKPIQATLTLSGKNTVSIIKQALKSPSDDANEKEN